MSAQTVFNSLKKKKKDKCVNNHLIKRLKQRFNIDATNNDIMQLVSYIKKGNSEYLGSQSNVRTLHKVNFCNVDMIAVYNKEKKLVHTVFPVEWLNTSKSFVKRSDKVSSMSGMTYYRV